MKRIVAIIRDSKLNELKDALLARSNLGGMTITEVKGRGRQKGVAIIYKGGEYRSTFVPKIMVEILTDDVEVDGIVKTISMVCFSKEYGSGKVWIEHVEKVYRVRTGETGSQAI